MSKFETKPLNVWQMECRKCLEASFEQVSDQIEEYSENSRYKALALTALEQSAMWANKAIAFDDES